MIERATQALGGELDGFRTVRGRRFGACAELGSLLDLYKIVRLQQIRWESLVCGSGLSATRMVTFQAKHYFLVLTPLAFIAVEAFAGFFGVF
jgi:hypothetical protein